MSKTSTIYNYRPAALLSIIVSIILHLLLGLFVALGIFNYKEQAPDAQPIIYARIYDSSVQEKEELVQQDVDMQQDVIPDPQPETLIEADQERTISSEPNVSSMDIDQPEKMVDEIEPQKQTELENILLDSPKEKDLLEYAPAPLGSNKDNLDALFESRTQRYFENLEQQKIDEIAVRHFQEYEYNRLHPILKGVQSSTLTSEEQLKEDIAIRVNCNSTLGKTMNLLSKFVGVDKIDSITAPVDGVDTKSNQGTITCRPSYDIDSFIKNRIDKSGSPEVKN